MSLSNRASRNGTANASDEESPLLGNGSKEPRMGKRLHKHMTANVHKSWADIALLGCYIITGLLDSSAVFIWGAFVSMQTGTYPLDMQITCHFQPPLSRPTCDQTDLIIMQETRFTLASASSTSRAIPAGSNPPSPSASFVSDPSSSVSTTAPSRPANAGSWSRLSSCSSCSSPAPRLS